MGCVELKLCDACAKNPGVFTATRVLPDGKEYPCKICAPCHLILSRADRILWDKDQRLPKEG